MVYNYKMKSFTILQTLIYNPILKSSKKKPIESDIQQAKIIAYLPHQAPIQQKCNTVGMAEGVYEFSRSLLTQQQRQSNEKKLVIFMDSCCLVQKQYQENTWVFLKLSFQTYQSTFTKFNQDQQSTYIDNTITQQIAFNILDHFYLSFRIFYGPLSAYVFLKKQAQLQKTLFDFSISYEQNNRLQQTKRLDASSYLIKNIRALPLDVNSTLKFNYFKNVLESYDQNTSDIVIFSNGMLAYSSLSKQYSSFFQSYFYGTGQPFKYDFNSMNKKLKIVNQLNQINQTNKYGTFFNSMSFGLGNIENSSLDSRLSTSIGLRKTLSGLTANKLQSNFLEQDLLGLAESQSLAFPQVYLNKNGQQNKYLMTFFMEKKMLFLTFYKNLNSKQQIIFQNRFYYDNIGKFSYKISELLNGILSQVDNYRFIYCNLNTFTGKISIQKWSAFVPQMRYVWQIIQNNKQSQVVTTIQNHWIYGIHRLNRVLALMIPSEVPLPKLDQFADKMFKQYFVKAFM